MSTCQRREQANTQRPVSDVLVVHRLPHSIVKEHLLRRVEIYATLPDAQSSTWMLLHREGHSLEPGTGQALVIMATMSRSEQSWMGPTHVGYVRQGARDRMPRRAS